MFRRQNGKLFLGTLATGFCPGDLPGRRPTLPAGGRVATRQEAPYSALTF